MQRPGEGISTMATIVVSSVSSQRRSSYARAWLEGQALDQELLLVGATSDGANELARQVAKTKGATFGWHRLSLTRLIAATAAPALAARGLVPRHSDYDWLIPS